MSIIVIGILLLLLWLVLSPSTGIIRALGGFDLLSGREEKVVRSNPNDDLTNENTLSNFYKVSSKSGKSSLYMNPGDVVFMTEAGKISLLTGEADSVIGERIPILKLTKNGTVQILTPGDDSKVVATLGNPGPDGIYVLEVTDSAIFAKPEPVDNIQPPSLQIYPRPTNIVSNTLTSGEVLQSVNSKASLSFNYNGDLILTGPDGKQTTLATGAGAGTTAKITVDSNGIFTYDGSGSTIISFNGWLPDVTNYNLSISDNGEILINNIQVYPRKSIDVMKSIITNPNTASNILNEYTTFVGSDGTKVNVVDNGLKFTLSDGTESVITLGYKPLIKLMDDGSVRLYDCINRNLPGTGRYNNGRDKVGSYVMSVDKADMWLNRDGETVYERVLTPFTKKVSIANGTFDFRSQLTSIYDGFVAFPMTIEMSRNGILRCKKGQYSTAWNFQGNKGYNSTLQVDASGRVLYGDVFMGTYAINNSIDDQDFTISQYGELYYDGIRVYIDDAVTLPFPSQLKVTPLSGTVTLSAQQKLLSRPSGYYGLEVRGKNLSIHRQTDGVEITRLAAATDDNTSLILNATGELRFGTTVLNPADPSGKTGTYTLTITDGGKIEFASDTSMIFARQLFKTL